MKASKITTICGVIVILFALWMIKQNWTPLFHFRADATHSSLYHCLRKNLLYNAMVVGPMFGIVSGIALCFAADHGAVKNHFKKHGLHE